MKVDGSAPAGVPRCPLCGEAGVPAFEKLGYAHHDCTGCHTLFVHPVPPPEILSSYYQDVANEQKSRVCWEQSHRHAHAGWRRMLGRMARLAGTGPLLDVGCGAGQFLAFARDLGWDELEGIELSPGAAEAARQVTGAPIHQKDLLTASLGRGRLAAVTMWDVLEHLSDPRFALRRVYDLLRPGGVVVVATPNRWGVTLRTLGSRTLVVTPPEHLFLATRRGLLAAMVAEKLEIQGVQTVDIYLKEWVRLFRKEEGAGREAASSPAGPETDGGPERRAYVRTYERLTSFAAFAVLQGLANALLRATGLGDQIVMLAQKPAGRPDPRGVPGEHPPG